MLFATVGFLGLIVLVNGAVNFFPRIFNQTADIFAVTVGVLGVLLLLLLTTVVLGVTVALAYMLWMFLREMNRIERERQEYRYIRAVDQTNDMDHYEFEKFAGYVLEHYGFKIKRVTRRSQDGGIDLNARKDGKKIAVQVKHYKIGNNVGSEMVQAFVGAYKNKADEGILITSSSFTPPARIYAKDHKELRLINRADLGEMILNIPQVGDE